MTSDNHQKKGLVEPDYQPGAVAEDNPIEGLINPDPDLIEYDDDIDGETIDGAIEEIIRRKKFWEKYGLLRGLEVKYPELLKELKHEKVIRQLVKERFKEEDLSIIENEQGKGFDLNKVEGLVQIVKATQLKEDVLRGAIPLLKSDKQNEAFSIFFLAARSMKLTHPKILSNCIEGTLFMIHGLEDQLDQDRLDFITDVTDTFISAHLSPITLKHGIEYAAEQGHIHLMKKIIQHAGRLIEVYRKESLEKAIDLVRAIDLDARDFRDAELDLIEILDEYIVKELVRAGAIELACKLAKRYGITEQAEKAEVYKLLEDINHAQALHFDNLTNDTELLESETS